MTMRRSLILTTAALLLAGGCRERPADASGTRPRVVTFSPALTDLVWQMGLSDHVVAVTNYCALPAAQSRPAVGDRMHVNVEAILSARPDVVLIQQDAKPFEALRRVNPSIRIEKFEIETLKDILSAIDRIGQVLGKADVASRFKKGFLARLDAVRSRVRGLPRPRVLFTMGYGSPVVARDDNFIGDLIELAGGKNAGADIKGLQRWQKADIESVLVAAPEVLICQADPGREAKARQFWTAVRDLPAARDQRVFVVTDRRWTIASAHVAELAEKLSDMIHPPGPGRRAGHD